MSCMMHCCVLSVALPRCPVLQRRFSTMYALSVLSVQVGDVAAALADSDVPSGGSRSAGYTARSAVTAEAKQAYAAGARGGTLSSHAGIVAEYLSEEMGAKLVAKYPYVCVAYAELQLGRGVRARGELCGGRTDPPP